MTERNHFRAVFLFIFLGIFLCCQSAFSQCADRPEVFVQFDLNIPGVCDEMLFPDFWLKNVADQDQVIMTPAEIERYNRKGFADCDVLKDLRNFPAAMAGDLLHDPRKRAICKARWFPKNITLRSKV